MEERITKIIVSKAGGNAGVNSNNYKISLPSKWVKELNLAEKNLKICKDGEKIIIAPKLSIEEFIKQKKAENHKLVLFSYFDKDKLCTEICADFTDKTIEVLNYEVDIIKTAFGNNETPTFEDFEEFLEERCLPRTRSGIREYLDAIGVLEYDPIEIIGKTKGKLKEDSQWIKMEELL